MIMAVDNAGPIYPNNPEEVTAAAWAVVSTKPQAEHVAERAIRDAGYEPWLPMYRKRLIGARLDGGRRVRSRAGGVVMRPLIPTYLFVLLPWGDGGHEINRTLHGVRGLMRYPEGSASWGKPKFMRARILVHLRELVDAGEFDEVRSGNFAVKVGDTVRTTTGFAGLLLSLDEQGRYELLSEYMGDKRPIRGDDAWTLEAVSA